MCIVVRSIVCQHKVKRERTNLSFVTGIFIKNSPTCLKGEGNDLPFQHTPWGNAFSDKNIA